MIALDVLQHSARFTGPEGPFECHKNVCWNDQRAKNGVFGHLVGFGLLDRLDIAYWGGSKCIPTLLTAVFSCNEAEILA